MFQSSLTDTLAILQFIPFAISGLSLFCAIFLLIILVHNVLYLSLTMQRVLLFSFVFMVFQFVFPAHRVTFFFSSVHTQLLLIFPFYDTMQRFLCILSSTNKSFVF